MTTENKTTKTIEISAASASCPDKPMHRMKLAQTCATCSTFIPALPAYNSAEYQTYFAPPHVEAPPNPYGPDAENARLWLEYEAARQAFEDSCFAVADAQRGRAQIRGSHVGADGNTVVDDGVFVRGARADQSIAELEAKRERLRTEAQAVLFSIQKADARRGALAQRAMFLESFPEPEPSRGITARIGDALRGS